MNKTSVITLVSCMLMGIRSVAGDLTVEGNLNVTSNLTAQGLSTANATVNSLVVNGSALFGGPIQGDGSGLTNLNLSSALGNGRATRLEAPDGRQWIDGTGGVWRVVTTSTNMSVVSIIFEDSAMVNDIHPQDVQLPMPTMPAVTIGGLLYGCSFTNGVYSVVVAHPSGGGWIAQFGWAMVPATLSTFPSGASGSGSVDFTYGVATSHVDTVAMVSQLPSTNGLVNTAGVANIAAATLGAYSATNGMLSAFATNGWTVSAHAAWLTAETDSAALTAIGNHSNRRDNPHGVTAAQLGALTNEADAVALDALAQYATLNRVTHWQDSADSNIWWEANGGTNLTAYRIEPKYGWTVSVSHNIYEYEGGPLIQAATNFVSELPYPVSGGNFSGVNIEDYWAVGYGIIAITAAPFSFYESTGIYPESESFSIPCFSYWWEDANLTPSVSYQYGILSGLVTNRHTSFNLATGDVWTALSSISTAISQQSTMISQHIDIDKVTEEVTVLRDSVSTNIWWKSCGGTNLQTFTTHQTSLWVCVNTDLYNYSGGLVYAAGTTDVLGMPREPSGVYAIGSSGYMVGTTDTHTFGGSYSLSDSFGWASGSVGFYASNSGYTGSGSFTWITRTETNIIASCNLPTGDVWQAMSALYPASNPSNFVSASAADAIVNGATSNLLSVAGDGSRLTGITAAQIGALTVEAGELVSAAQSQTSANLSQLTALIAPVWASGTAVLDKSRILLFDDYASPVWTHEGPLPLVVSLATLKAGTNHYSTTGWRLLSCRTGTARFCGREVAPDSSTNFAANLQNTLGAVVQSPVFPEGIGTIYFEAINNIYLPTQISLEYSTNSVDWILLTNHVLNASSPHLDPGLKAFTRSVTCLNYRLPASIRIRRSGSVYSADLDEALTVVDNIRVPPPPSILSAYRSPDYTGLGYEYSDEGRGGCLTNDRLALLSEVPSAAALGVYVKTNHTGDVAVEGILAARTFAGDGSGLTNLIAANITGLIVAGSLATGAVESAAIAAGAVGTNQLADGAVTSAKILDGTIVDADIAAGAAIDQTKISGLTNAVVSLSTHLTAINNPHGVTAAQVGAYTINQTDVAIAGALSGFNPGSCIQTNHSGDVAINGNVSASSLMGNGSGITNLNLAAYAGANLTWDAVSNTLNAAAVGASYTDADAVSAVTAGDLNMNSNRVIGLADAVDGADAVNRRTMQAAIQQALLNVGPLGDLSMGTFTAH